MAHVSHHPLGNRCCDHFFTVEVATVRRLVTYDVSSSSCLREKCTLTPRPDGAFMMQVGRNLTDPLKGFLRGKRLLILDRDQKFTTEFRDLLEHRRRRCNDDGFGFLAEKKLSGDQPASIVLPRPVSAAMNIIHAQAGTAPSKRFHLIGIDLDALAERRLEQVRVGSGDTVPTECMQKGREIAR